MAGRLNWGVLVTFLGVQIALGIWAARRVHSESDYFVAGRTLGLPLVSMSLFATWFGAETCLGASGAVYRSGLSGGRADPFGYTICLIGVGLLLATGLARGRFVTLGDLFRERFGPSVERLVVLLLVPSSLIWGAAQVRALGQVLSETSSLPTEPAIVVAACFVVAYTFVGGLLGDVVNDFLQGIVLAIGLVGLAVAVVPQLPPDVFERTFTPERLALWPPDESIWVQLDRWAVPIFGSLVTQEMVARLLAAKSATVARRGSFIAAGIYLVVGSIPVLLGLVGPVLAPDLADPERLLPVLAARTLSPILFVVFACALLSAILSTVDSVLLSSSALLAHNVLVPALGWTGESAANEKRKVWLGRLVVLLSGAFALAVALSAESIYALVELASTLGTAGLGVTTLVALHAKKPNRRAAFTALCVGAVTNPTLEYGFDFSAPFLTAFAASTLSYFVLAALFPPDPTSPETADPNARPVPAAPAALAALE